jgi:AcrR family transcriptional regulator
VLIFLPQQVMVQTIKGEIPVQEPQKLKKSDRTRLAILTAAGTLFAQNGFDRTTVRDIAAEAGADPALVVRYFGGKEALFVQSADFSLGLEALPPIATSELGQTLAGHFLDVWEGERAGGLPVLLRSASSNELAAERMREIFSKQVAPFLRTYLPADQIPTRAALISSLLLGVALGRYILKLPPLVALTRQQIVSLIGQTLQTLAFGDIADNGETAIS